MSATETEVDPPFLPMSADREFRLLVEREAPALLGYFTRRVEPIQDAADLLNETFLVVWRRADAAPAGEALRPWVYGVARKVLANHRRSAVRRSALAARLRDELIAARSSESTPASDIEESVRAAIRMLPDRQREVVMLVYWEGFSLDEIAAILGMPASTVRSHHARARKRLQAALG